MTISVKRWAQVGGVVIVGASLAMTLTTRCLVEALQDRVVLLNASFVGLAGFFALSVYYSTRLLGPGLTRIGLSRTRRWILLALPLVGAGVLLDIHWAASPFSLETASEDPRRGDALVRTTWGERHESFELHAGVDDDSQSRWRTIARIPPIVRWFGGDLELFVTQPDWVVLDEQGKVNQGPDGVVVRFSVEANDVRRTVHEIILNPYLHPEQRRWQKLEISVPSGNQRLVVEALPGSLPDSNNWNDRLWISYGRFKLLDALLAFTDWVTASVVAFFCCLIVVLIHSVLPRPSGGSSAQPARRLSETVSDHALACGGAVLTFGASIVTLTAALLSIGVVSSGSYCIFGLASAYAFIVIAWRPSRRRVRHATVSALLFTALLLLATTAGAQVYDISWDGQAYHQEAILQLASGLNPIVQEGSGEYATWIDHYPKANWYVGAAVFRALGDIEAGKLNNLLLMVAAGLLLYRAARTFDGLTPGRAALLSTLAALNPVSVSQALSFYVDGQIGSLILCLIATGCIAYRENGHHGLSLFLHAASLVLLVNTKFTGVVYAAIMAAAVMACHRHRSTVRGYSIFFATVMIVAVFFVGYAPYYRNLTERGHMFYPVMGRQAIDILTYNSQTDFVDSNRFANMLTSLFSRSANTGAAGVSELKLPLTIDRSEVLAFDGMPDMRIGGFGPWFSGILIVSHVLLASLVLTRRFSRRALALYVCLVASVCVNPAMWWARYVPQLWFVPIVILAEALRRDLGPALAVLRVTLVFFILTNACFISIRYLDAQLAATRKIDEQLQTMNQANDRFLIDFGQFRALRARLTRHGIQFTEQTDHPPDAEQLWHTHSGVFVTRASR
jgi:hypothetical protein